jgi:hypothetical protein
VVELTDEALRRGLRVALGVQAQRRRRARERTGLTVSDRRTRAPAVLVLTPDFDHPSAGVRVMYRHVDILREAGVEALVLHTRPGFRCSWFESDTPVTDTRQTALEPDDVVVVGEREVDLVARLPRPVRHLVLNQSGYLAWDHEPDVVSRHYVSPHAPEAVIATSEHIADVCRFAFPGIEVRRVRLSVDPHLFTLAPGTPATRLAYMPRRGADDAALALRLLAARGSLADWELVAIRGMSAQQVASELRRASIFLSVSPREGFGMPPLEAMASGAYVVGYDALGGKEFLRPAFSSPVETGNVLALAQALDEALTATPGWRRSRGLAAATFAREHYAPELERESVMAAYAGLVTA